MAQNLVSTLPNGGVSSSQRVQDYHYPQQGLGATTPPQGLYPSKQEPGYGQNPAGGNQQGYHVPYNEQRAPQNQFPVGPGYGTPSSQPGNLPYPQQQPYAPVGENASYYGTAPLDQYGNPIGPAGPQDEKGLGSTVVGGAAGGYAGHKLGGGFLGSTAGAVLGAIGMNAATHQV
ncbi:unnamed protein product [Penicillium pancosmium]